MQTLPFNVLNKVLIATQFLQDSDKGEIAIPESLRIGVALASRARVELRLTHVVEPHEISMLLGSSWEGWNWGTRYARTYELLHEQQVQRRELAEKHMLSLAAQTSTAISSLNPSIEPPAIQTMIVEHEAAAVAINADAVASGSDLIVVGANKASFKKFRRSFTTALGLANNSQIPVLVVTEDVRLDLLKPRVKILVADNLSEYDAALSSAVRLALSLKNSDILHVHLSDWDTRMVNKMVTTMTKKDPQLAKSRDISREIINTVVSEGKQILADRCGDCVELLKKSGSTYQSDFIIAEHPQDVLTEVAEKFGADVIVFGKHHPIHWRPLQFGKIPSHIMLDQKQAVIIAP